MIRFVIPGPPQGKGRPRLTTRGGYAHAYTPPKTASYEALAAQMYKLAYPNLPPITGAVEIVVTAYIKIPESWPRRKKAQALAEMIFPTVKPDASNILKSVEDALNGLAYEDDKQIVYASICKKYSIEPRVEVQIWETKNEGVQKA